MRLDLFTKSNLSDMLKTSGLPDPIKNALGHLPRSFWQKEIELGNIKFKNKIVKSSTAIEMSQIFYLSLNWKNIKNNWSRFYEKKLIPKKIKVDSLKVTSDLLVVNKPAGLSVHPTFPMKRSGKRDPSLIEGIICRYPEIANVFENNEEERPGIVHRLDKNTSGVLLVARNLATKKLLKQQFQKKTIKKTYLALVAGKFPYDRFEISSLVGKMAANPLKQGVSDLIINNLEKNKNNKLVGPKFSETKGEVVSLLSPEEKNVFKFWEKHIDSKKNDFTFLKLFPSTGRTHQIRVHLSSLGFPVVGDRLYGSRDKIANFHCLHAYKISWLDRSQKRQSARSDKIILF